MAGQHVVMFSGTTTAITAAVNAFITANPALVMLWPLVLIKNSSPFEVVALFQDRKTP